MTAQESAGSCSGWSWWAGRTLDRQRVGHMTEHTYGQGPPSGPECSGSGSGQTPDAQALNAQLLDDAFGLPESISGFPDFGLELPMASGHPGIGGQASFSGIAMPYNLAGA